MMSSKKLTGIAGAILVLCIAAAAPVVTATAAYASDNGGATTSVPTQPAASPNGNPWHG
jgi:hypothetical protein